MTKLAVDGDVYAYQYAATNGEYVELDGWLFPKWDMRRMRGQWKEFVEDKLPSHTELIICFSDSVNFRKSVCSSYKAKRTAPKPVMYKPLVDWIKDIYPTEVWPTLEADDVLGILSTRDGFTVVTEDKDLQTIPGNRWDTKSKSFKSSSPDEADRFWMTQTITGDPTDGYPGLPGSGPAAVEKILNGTTTLEEMWPRVVEAYAAKGLPIEDAIKQARLARILRHGDYDHVKKEVKLWMPSSM